VEQEVREVVAGGVLAVEEVVEGEREDDERPEIVDREPRWRPPRARRVDVEDPPVGQRLVQARQVLDVEVVVGEERRGERRRERDEAEDDESESAAPDLRVQRRERIGLQRLSAFHAPGALGNGCEMSDARAVKRRAAAVIRSR
jgi:hypothetical protein